MKHVRDSWRKAKGRPYRHLIFALILILGLGVIQSAFGRQENPQTAGPDRSNAAGLKTTTPYATPHVPHERGAFPNRIVTQPFNLRDVFAGVGNGIINQYNSGGALQETLNTTSGSQEETGMCFDASGNLYTTNLNDNTMSKFEIGRAHV